MGNPFDLIKKTYSTKSLPDDISDKFKVPNVQSKICGNCGYDFNEFIKTGYLGCSDCYQYFKKELESYINEFR